MPVNKNGLPFYLDRKLDVIRFGVDSYNHVKEQQLFNSPVKTEKPNKKNVSLKKKVNL
ncbi:UvaB protein [Enterococcus faecalis]|uniref:UvaB protein n=1 Tax=Enterococcus faecalis TaxID=1351 RepID=UPI0027E0AD79|nr:UvaB protein [Enterococcus faecalis]MDQ6109908.1 UvaB protein [Enterococcus faecalis]MDQ6186277.1 UvaB protein [Enterococcus faecalis]MDQ6225627.1 UvaB protein [Enterococcus faecalis]